MNQQAPAWAAKYVGVPFVDLGRTLDGCDCFGLVRLVYAERYGIELADQTEYEGTDKFAAPQIEQLIERERVGADWAEIPAGEEREGDVILVRVLNLPIHVGLILTPGVALHTMSTPQDSVLLRYRDQKYSHIIAQPGRSAAPGTGFFRHRAMVIA